MRKIYLTKGKFAIVDNEDYEWLSQWKWFAHRQRTGNFYAARKGAYESGKQATIYMHREILKPKRGLVCDHINHAGLDNRRENLRVCSGTENRRNRTAQKNNTSGFKGVSWDKDANKWKAIVGLNGKLIHVGRFSDLKDAAFAYNEAAKRLFGRFAHLNKI